MLKTTFVVAGLLLLAACSDATAPTPISGGLQRQGPRPPCDQTGVNTGLSPDLRLRVQEKQCQPIIE